MWMNVRHALFPTLALCTALTVAGYYLHNHKTRMRLQDIMAEADKSVMSEFGLSYNGAQMAWSSQSRSRAVLSLRRLLSWRFLGGVPSTRTERHFLGSGSEMLETRLDIRREHLHKVEVIATAGCVPAAQTWGKHVRRHFPHVEIVINGKQLE